MNILIGLPAYRNEVKAGCALSLLGLFRLFSSLKVAGHLHILDMADPVIVRNIYGTLMLENPAYTHLLFIDNDMEFRADAVKRMIESRLSLIGVVCPKREIDLQKFHAAAKTMPLPQALSAAMQFNVIPAGTKTALTQGIGTVNAVGLAISLIERRVFVELAAKVRHERERHPGFMHCAGPLHGFFDQIQTADGTMLTEDFSFCERWRTLCNGTVSAIFDEEIGHHGHFVYRAKYPGVP